MSQHPSLRVDSVGAKHRNVLSRLERIKKMKDQGKWGDRTKAFGLPKIKSLKIKVKKSSGPKEEGEGAEGAGAAPAAAPAKNAGKK